MKTFFLQDHQTWCGSA